MIFYNYLREMVNIGQRIKEELDRQERPVSWLARKLNCSRTEVYRIMKKNSIDTALLSQICQVLNYNFFKELSDSVENAEKWYKNVSLVFPLCIVWCFVRKPETSTFARVFDMWGICVLNFI